MPHYAYKAKDAGGKTVTGLMEAPSEDQVDLTLRQKGLYVISVQARTEPTQRAKRPAASVGRVSRRDLILFTTHLGILFSAGVSLTDGLREFAQEPPNPRLGRVAASVLQSVEEGALLSEAMARLPGTFPEVYVAMVRAGETSGRLDQVLMDLVKSLEWQEEIARQIRQASIYPIILLSAFSGLVIFLVTFVFPRFSVVLSRIGAPLPLPTRILMGAGDFFRANWAMLLLGIFALVLGYRFLRSVPAGRLLVDRVKLRLPILGNIFLEVALARFAHHMETLYRAGVEFVRALTVLEQVVGNRVIARAVAQARERVIAGMSFTDALRSTGQFPPLVLRMVGTGETSGSLDVSLAKVTQYYDREVPNAVRRFFAFLEPAIIACLAGVVLVAVLSVYLPIYSLLSNVRARAPR